MHISQLTLQWGASSDELATHHGAQEHPQRHAVTAGERPRDDVCKRALAKGQYHCIDHRLADVSEREAADEGNSGLPQTSRRAVSSTTPATARRRVISMKAGHQCEGGASTTKQLYDTAASKTAAVTRYRLTSDPAV